MAEQKYRMRVRKERPKSTRRIDRLKVRRAKRVFYQKDSTC